ncbi:MAG: MATE family efflux transporter [Clostridiales bacterium]|jgi:putative MATE family efflux protein|nr:MATE family efflux transporter [Clostridiales bacterium]
MDNKKAEAGGSSEARMASGSVRWLVLSYSIPTIIGMTVNSLYGIADRFWVGQIQGAGHLALSGIGLSLPITNIIMALSMLAGIGAAANISIQLGKGNREGARVTAANALTVILIFCLLFTVFGYAFAPQFLSLVGATPELLPYSLPYTRIIIGGSVFNMASFAMNHPIRATGNPRRFALTQLVGGITNIVLDPIFIFVFGLGVEGAAIATIISQAVAAVMVFSYYFSKDAVLKLSWANMRPRPSVIKAIFSIGVSPFILQLTNSFIVALANSKLAEYGARDLGLGGDAAAIGAMTVIMSVNMLFCMPVFGINQGSQPIVGFNYGRRNASRVKSAFLWSALYAVIITTFGFLVVQIGAEGLVSAFNKDGALTGIGSKGMRIFLCMLPLVGFQIPASNFFQAIGRAKMSIVLSLLRQVLLLVPLYFILPPFFGLDGVWAAQPISDFIATAVSCALIAREFKILDRKLKPQEPPAVEPSALEPAGINAPKD